MAKKKKKKKKGPGMEPAWPGPGCWAYSWELDSLGRPPPQCLLAGCESAKYAFLPAGNQDLNEIMDLKAA